VIVMSEPIAAPRRAAVIFIFVTVLLDMLALGLIIPVAVPLILTFHGGDTVGAAGTVGLFNTVWALAHFFCSPILGALSDRFGRRPVILLSNVGLGADYVALALAPSLGWLLVGRIVSGITAASISTAHAYVADVTPPERRAAGFGLLGAAFGIGFVLGPALGGLLGAEDPRLPFWVAAGLSLANALYGYFVLPESLPPERRAPFAWKRANPIGALVLLRTHQCLLPLALVNFLSNLAHASLPTTFVLYAGYRYGWDERAVGLTLAMVGICSIIVQTWAVGPVVARIGERRALLAGLGFGIVGFFVYGLAEVGWVFWLGIPIMTLWGLTAPSAQGLMTRQVGPHEQGRLQGANGSLAGIAELIGPGLFTWVFAWFIATGTPWHQPGAPYLLAGLILAAAFALAAAGARR
jgi:DHA1 family tetracycline resistance protein-like MFS transporter